ncbi:MAG: primosomal protein N' [Candidatus Caenarcaniphilales bacterium]|nr:primosomal protein N' [Candidatus Caenarcaniphilales bacterium]
MESELSIEEQFDKLSEIVRKKYAKVLVDSNKTFLDGKVFDYLIPDWFVNKLQVGSFVQVPFGKNKAKGLVIQIEEHSEEYEYEVKEITAILKSKIFTEEYMDLLNWVSDFYQVDLLTTLKGVLPISLLGTIQERVVLKELIKYPNFTKIEQQIYDFLKESYNSNFSLGFLKKKVNSSRFNIALNSLIEKNVVEKTIKVKTPVETKSSSDLQINKIHSFSVHNAKETYSNLSQNQNGVFNQIDSQIDEEQFSEFLIHGVTGSGKTEIYFAAAHKVLAKSKQVIYLVPEISLTVQLVDRIKNNFPHHEITLWHSNLSAGERLKAWNECLDSKPRMIVGARSAVFAPLDNLGLIIIDEEHDASYKSGNKPFYDARVIAKRRAELSNSVVISGSATPSVAKYYESKKKNQLLELKQRFNQRPLPQVEIVDMRRELNDGNRSIFSRSLKNALNECIEKKDQAILLLNRRGYANYVFCRDCGYAVFCDNCSVPLIYHSSSGKMHCHHCETSKPVLKECPNCGSKRIKQTGLGTQKLEQEVIRNFPQADVIRLDRDISSKRYGMQEVWNQLTVSADKNKSQILIGTQLVAKGIDLPRVTLVASIHSESGMYMPDFLASERTFQLLTQVAGRAGRHDKEGRVIFQTYIPENKVIQNSANHDYESFYENELLNRQEFLYPPYRQLARIILHNKNEDKAKNDAKEIAGLIKSKKFDIELLGPAPCPIERIKEMYRWQLLLKSTSIDCLKEANYLISSELKITSRLSFDLMPISLV